MQIISHGLDLCTVDVYSCTVHCSGSQTLPAPAPGPPCFHAELYQNSLQNLIVPKKQYRGDIIRMDFFKIPISLVPRATTIRACVTFSVVFTLLGRLVELGSLVLGNNLMYSKLYTQLNSDESQQESRIIQTIQLSIQICILVEIIPVHE